MAFLHLGIIHAQGTGTEQNDILASYFIKKAIDMGCKEAEEYLNIGYETGDKDFASEIEAFIGDGGSMSRETFAWLKAKVEAERRAKNYGNLSNMQGDLMLFYPEYDRDKAIGDILNNRDTVDADILLATCTSNNRFELYANQQDKLLSQLHAPIEKLDVDWKNLKCNFLGHDEGELAQCIVNFTCSYKEICRHYHVEQEDIFTLDTLRLFPYVRMTDLLLLRCQALRCLLSIKDIDPIITERYLKRLRDDSELLNIAEEVRGQNLQLLLISFVEMNIDINALQLHSIRLFRAYKDNDLSPLADHLNTLVSRLTEIRVKHDLPTYTADTLPPIAL